MRDTFWIKLWHFIINIVCVTSRYLPVRHKAGLYSIGKPGKDSPVFVASDYFHTARRVFKKLSGQDCYLLIVDSAGINVWCAAGVGDFNEHKIADAVNTYDLKQKLNHNKLILPQLAAVGVDRKKLFNECGFKVVWGPAHLDDIPAYIANEMRCTTKMRQARNSWEDRIHMAIGMLFAYLFFYGLAYLVWSLLFGTSFHPYALATAILMTINITLTIFNDSMPLKWSTSNVILASSVSYGLIIWYSFWGSDTPIGVFIFYLFANSLIVFLLCMDMIGSSVKYKTSIIYWLQTWTNRSLFQPSLQSNCSKCRRCLEVCPKGLFELNNQTMTINYARECNECLAFIKQCPTGAIVNLNKGSTKGDIKSIPEDVLRDII